MSGMKKIMDRELTRRQFMKLTGKGLAGVALSSSLPKGAQKAGCPVPGASRQKVSR